VLETGAGTGIVTRRLRDLLPATTRLIATDLDPPMLEVAQKKFRPDEPIEFQHADAMALPFADTSFDAVVCQFGVMFCPDKEKSYREAYRVLAPGGRYVFSVWDGSYNRYGRMRHGTIADEVAAQFFPTDPPQLYRVSSSYNRSDPSKDSLSDAGFIDLRIAVLTREKQVADIGAFARAMVYGNPLIDMIRTRAAVDPDQVVKALGEAFAREFGNPALLPLQAILFEAARP
jgi:SAM-dependent methyltransferase